MFRIGWFRVTGVMATLFTTSGCIVAEPPGYEPPEQTAPLLDLAQATPWIGQALVVNTVDEGNPRYPTSVDFRVPVRSEDRDEYLNFALHVDYQSTLFPPSPAAVKSQLYPSNFEDERRTLYLNWTVHRNHVTTDGCHQVTLVVAHESNWIFAVDRPDPILAAGDIGMATWWVNVNPPPGEENNLTDCPRPGQEVER